ncbi:hypothetical protein UB51_15855 [Paenibacillus sp. IHBB 10380]|nr:hypothetical protein UB51_15855 [Paenibacillus sp. IHBB 10380]
MVHVTGHRYKKLYLIRLCVAKCRANMGGTTEETTFRPSHREKSVVKDGRFFVLDSCYMDVILRGG